MTKRILVFSTVLVAAVHAAEPPREFSEDFEKQPVGELPDGMMEIEGTFTVEDAGDGKKALRMKEAPLNENAVIMGSSFKGGGAIEARVKADKKRRSFPRFGVGLHGISGYRLRVNPARKVIELVKNEEVVKSEPFAWKSEIWTRLRLEIRNTGSNWSVFGFVWPDGEKKPEKPGISLSSDKTPGKGKGSLWGTPYAGKAIWFDDVKITADPPEG